MNVSISSSASSTNVRVDLRAPKERRGGLTLSLAFRPSLTLNASVRHSVETSQASGLRVPVLMFASMCAEGPVFHPRDAVPAPVPGSGDFGRAQAAGRGRQRELGRRPFGSPSLLLPLTSPSNPQALESGRRADCAL